MKRVEIFLIASAVLASVMTASTACAMPLSPSGQSSAITIDSVSAMTDTTELHQIAASYQGQELAAAALNRLGDLLYQDKAYSSARQVFLQTTSQYLGFPTETADAEYWLGKIAFHDNKYPDAETYFTRFLAGGSKGEKSQWARYYLTRAEYRDGTSDYSKAVQAYFAQPDSAAASHDYNIRYDLIRYLMNHHQYSSALAAADAFTTRYPNTGSAVKVQFQEAIIHEVMGQSDEAVQIYQSIISNASSKLIAAHAQFELATDYQGQGKYEEAVSEFNKIPLVYPDQLEYVDGSKYALAMIKYSESLAAPDSGKLGEEAFDALRTFVSNYPADSHTPRALMALADLYNKRGDYQSANGVYEKVIHFDTLNVALNPKAMARSNDLKAYRGFVREARLAEGNDLMIKLHDSKDALAAFHRILKASPGSHEARLKEAMCYIDLGQKDSAEVLLNSLVHDGGKDTRLATSLLRSVTSADSAAQTAKGAK